MRKTTFTVFDEYLPAGTTSSAPAFTDSSLAALLAMHSELALHVVLDEVSGTPAANGNFYLYVEHTSDGIDWIQLMNQHNNFMAADADINITLNGSNNPPLTVFAQQMWSDASPSFCRLTAMTNGGPTLTYVRFRLFFSDPAMAAHVSIHVTQRDKH